MQRVVICSSPELYAQAVAELETGHEIILLDHAVKPPLGAVVGRNDAIDHALLALEHASELLIYALPGVAGPPAQLVMLFDRCSGLLARRTLHGRRLQLRPATNDRLFAAALAGFAASAGMDYSPETHS